MLRRSLTSAELKEYLNADGMPSLASSLRVTVDGDNLIDIIKSGILKEGQVLREGGYGGALERRTS